LLCKQLSYCIQRSGQGVLASAHAFAFSRSSGAALPQSTRVGTEVTDAVQAQGDPELAVLSAIAHGHDADIHKAAQIARAARLASDCLDEDRSVLYLDLIMASLSAAARGELEIMKPAGYEFQSDFARHHFARGQAQGRAALVLKQLTRRFGPLTQQVEARIAEASIAQLDEIGERLLTAQTLDEALGSS
jgi:hypothetical protein